MAYIHAPHAPYGKSAKKQAPASPAQLSFLSKLAADLEVEVPVVQTKTHASAQIEELLSQRQAKWDAERAAKKAAEAEALEAVNPWTAGRVSVAGEILSAKVKDTAYGPTYKMLLKDDKGRKLWMTVPKSLYSETHTLEELKGMKVSGVVTVKPSDDPHFAYGSRPAGWGVVK